MLKSLALSMKCARNMGLTWLERVLLCDWRSNLNRNQNRKLLIIGIIAAVVLVAVTLANIAYTTAHPGGNHFVVGWAGTQAFFADGTSPYSAEAAVRIQNAASWVTAPAEKETLWFVSPLYVIGLYAPFALVKNYAAARGLWMTLLEVCLVSIPLLTFSLIRKRAPLWMIIGAILASVVSYHGIQPLLDGNAVIFFTVILLLLIKAVDSGHDETAGILLAVATMSLQNTLLAALFIFIWALRKQRKTTTTWFAGTLVLLVGFSVLLIPNWFVQELQAIIRLYGLIPAGSPGAFMAAAWGSIGLRFSIFLTVILAGLMLREWIQAFNGNETRFLWCVFLTLTLSQWIGIPTKPGNFILLMPGILFSLTIFLSRWGDKGKRMVEGILGLLVILPWLFVLILPAHSALVGLFLTIPLISVGLLYWTKWWAVGTVGGALD